MSAPQREKWNSSLGFILAAAGSAIGLGNIWRFPYITGKNGGGSFVLLYLGIVLLVGLPIMYLELALGRSTGKGPVGAIASVAPKSLWKFLGYLAVITGIGILSFYGVVAGWTVYYFFKSFISGFTPGQSGNVFGSFVTSGSKQIIFMGIFMGLTTGVVVMGVKGGIEKLSTVLMPVLLVLMLGLIIYAMTLPKAMSGLKFYLVPTSAGFTKTTFIYALGQAFFSLSLGMGAMLTYGSYLQKKENILRAGLIVVIFDTAIALMAGFIIFPVLGGAPAAAGPGLVFVVITDLFSVLPGGRIIAMAFFAMLAIAALTSTISLLEVAASYLIDEHKMKRPAAALTVGAITFCVGIPSALSLGASKFLSNIGSFAGRSWGFLDIFDYVFGNLSLAIGGMLLVVFVLWKWKLQHAEEEIFANSKAGPWVKYVLRPLTIFVAPAAVALVIGFLLFTGKTLS
ncbi:sodium-dependent transporter [Myxococcota bacterium]|nr:sodium-dependent transporter [Myxococcota bacterium]